jgi:nucleolar GTP-binding protein
MDEDPESDLDSEEEAAVYAIRSRKAKIKDLKLVNQTQNKPMMPLAIRGRTKDIHDVGVLNPKAIKEKMDSLGVDASAMLERGRSKERLERGRKRERSLVKALEDSVADKMDTEVLTDGASKGKLKKIKKADALERHRSVSQARSHSRPRNPSQMGLKDKESVEVAKKLDLQGRSSWKGGSGEGDQRKAVHLVKWMNTGKKRNGTHYCR